MQHCDMEVGTAQDSDEVTQRMQDAKWTVERAQGLIDG